MKERPILFSGPMVRAILAGRKTQTRRVVRTIEGNAMRLLPCIGSRTAMYLIDEMGPAWCPAGGDPPEPWPADRYAEISPYGVAGDRLWVRETWSKSALGAYPCPSAWYRADFTKHDDPALDAMHDVGCHGNRADCWQCVSEREGPFRWRPSIFMPRALSRITLEVTDVRVERLQDITEEDAKAEGVIDGTIPACSDHPALVGHVLGQDDGKCVLHPTRRRAFEVGWDVINGKRVPWARNPWVWAVSFRRVQP